MSKVLVLGKNGQVAKELAQTVPDDIETIFAGRNELDLLQPDLIADFIEKESPDVIINAAAYTAVDKAESDQDAAFCLNYECVQVLVQLCKKLNIRLIHISTDFVFDGSSNVPYKIEDKTSPLGVYGLSKLKGEKTIESGLENFVIVRTSWVYSAYGQNFLKTMVNLMKSRDSLGIIYDQVGTPTSAKNIANLLWVIAKSDVRGLYHYTDAGCASWFDFAQVIYQKAKDLKIFNHDILITPITSEQYPTPAKRPHYSVMDSSVLSNLLNLNRVHWIDAVQSCVDEVKENECIEKND